VGSRGEQLSGVLYVAAARKPSSAQSSYPTSFMGGYNGGTQ
jgi:hypothetical protein